MPTETPIDATALPPPAPLADAAPAPEAAPQDPGAGAADGAAFVPGSEFARRMGAVVREALHRAGLDQKWGVVQVCLARPDNWLSTDGTVQVGAIRHPLVQDKTVRPEQLTQALALIVLYARQVLQAPVAIPEDLAGPLQPELDRLAPDQVFLIRFMEEVEQRLNAVPVKAPPRAPASAPAIAPVAPAGDEDSLRERLRHAARRPMTYVVLSLVLGAAGFWGYLLFHSEATTLRPTRFAEVTPVKQAIVQTEFLKLVLPDGAFDQLAQPEQIRMAEQLLQKAEQKIRIAVIETPTTRYMIQHLDDGRTIISSAAPLTPPAAP